VNELRERFSIPVIAMEPGIKPAVEVTKSKVVGVLATAGTLESARFFSLVNRYAGDVEIVTQPCAGLVECIEANSLNDAETLTLLRGYLDSLLVRGADVIVLGCTHYPFLREQIKNIVGDQVAIIDTGPAVARELKRRLEQENLLRAHSGGGIERFWSNDKLSRRERIVAHMWGSEVTTFPFEK
jgi:glutamate racemase